jgi:hypothetical protein
VLPAALAPALSQSSYASNQVKALWKLVIILTNGDENDPVRVVNEVVASVGPLTMELPPCQAWAAREKAAVVIDRAAPA